MKNLLCCLVIFFSVSILFAHPDNKDGKKISKPSVKEGDSYIMNINNFYLPLNNAGVIAAVSDIGGRYGGPDGKVFLFSSGFFLSGYDGDTLWTNAVASASRVEDYIPGMSNGPRNDVRAQMYVVSASELDFSQSWIDWKDAVDLGADFYDGTKDGFYNPVDLNGNNKWDPNEDKPDIIGDKLVWCVYNDGKIPSNRVWNTNIPRGIDIRQSVYGFAAQSGAEANIIYVRYSLLYKGNEYTTADYLDSVYFGAWADPDIGDYSNNLVGSDTILQAGYTYQNKNSLSGSTPLCFLIDVLQGPIVYVVGETYIDKNRNNKFDPGIDESLSIAFNKKGNLLGTEEIPGAKNLNTSSFIHYYTSDPTLGDPDNSEEARNYLLGRDQYGKIPNPCTWILSYVNPPSICSTIDKNFWYSGDPVNQTGWVHKVPGDVKKMLNIGPFKLDKNIPVDIILAYVVGVGSDPISTITEAKNIDIAAQAIFDANFKEPNSVQDEDLVEAVSNNLDKVNVYPNPFYQTIKDDEITFSNLPPNSKIKIFTLNGELVKSLNSSIYPLVTWNLKNEGNQKVAPGMYLAMITAPGLGEKILKFAVISSGK